MLHFMIVLIHYIYINKLKFSWIKNAYFEEYGAFKEIKEKNQDC